MGVTPEPGAIRQVGRALTSDERPERGAVTEDAQMRELVDDHRLQ
jgi:hypothetical protein